jgi:molybdopterin molybdotransferase
MVEDTRESASNEVEVTATASSSYIRHVGSDLPFGALAVSKGAEIDVGTVALLAALGQHTADCTHRPRVAILTTGDEIKQIEEDSVLPFGTIFDANGPALVAAVRQAGGTVPFGHQHVADDPEAIRAALRKASQCDVVITSGGVSVGEFDYVKAAVEEIGSLDFWRIAIKPGKPLAFGRVGDALFFGLPGNPVSSLVTFELFVRPALRKLAGYSRLTRTVMPLTLGAPLPHQPGRREFARARLEAIHTKGGGDVRAYPLGAQDSHRLSSLAAADVLLIAHEDHGDYEIGETLPALMLR